MNNDVTVLQSDYNRIKKHTPTYQVIFDNINILQFDISNRRILMPLRTSERQEMPLVGGI